jgi:hypothetical protein
MDIEDDYFILFDKGEYDIELPYDKIKSKMLLGETCPISGFDVALKNVSHTILDMFINENIVYGKVKFLDTRMGKVVKEMYKNGMMPTFKMRGIKNNNIIKVFTFDVAFN